MPFDLNTLELVFTVCDPMQRCCHNPIGAILRCLQAALQAAGALQRLVALLRAADAQLDCKEAISAAAALRNFANTPANRAAVRWV